AGACGCGLGAGGHTRGRIRKRHPRRMRTDLRPAAEGNFLRPRAAAPVSDRTALQPGSAAATGDAAEDAAQYRGPGASTRSRPGSVEDSQTLSRALDERADRLARPRARHAERSAQLGDA